MRALPSSASSMRCTRPIGKPENVRSMPTTTPSESSAINTSFWVASNAPRAYSTYRAEPQTSSSMKSINSLALSSRLPPSCASDGAAGSGPAGGGGKGSCGELMGYAVFWGALRGLIIVADQRRYFDQQYHGKHADQPAHFGTGAHTGAAHSIQGRGHGNQRHGQGKKQGLEDKNQRDRRTEHLTKKAGVSGHARHGKTVPCHIGHHQRHQAAQRCQRNA